MHITAAAAGLLCFFGHPWSCIGNGTFSRSSSIVNKGSASSNLWCCHCLRIVSQNNGVYAPEPLRCLPPDTQFPLPLDFFVDFHASFPCRRLAQDSEASRRRKLVFIALSLSRRFFLLLSHRRLEYTRRKPPSPTSVPINFVGLGIQ